jgi:chemotaxis protein methyltransferase CheR
VTVSQLEFDFIAKLVRDEAAIVLQDGKEYLVDRRLAPIARAAGMQSVAELVRHLRADGRSPLRGQVVDALTINETLFLRDIHPFETLVSDLLPRLIAARETERRIRVWSAATSSGQEAFSVAMLVREHFPRLSTWDVDILGTDISPTMIARARRGVFRESELRRGLSEALRSRYFEREGDGWRPTAEVRRLVRFEQLNLIERWPPMEPMDVVLLRNVLIYFDQPTRRAILDRVVRLLRADGVLLLGGVETTMTHPELESRNNGRTTWFVRRPETVVDG